MVILILKNYRKSQNTVYICTKHYKNFLKKKTRKQKLCIFYGLKYKGWSIFYGNNVEQYKQFKYIKL